MGWWKFFPDIMLVHQKLEENDEHSDAPANERNFYNKFLHYGGKMNKKQKSKRIMYVNSF